jgi:hypothetical protein
LLVSLVLDVPEPDLSPVEDLLTPPMLDVPAEAVAAADQPAPGPRITSSTRSITYARASMCMRGRPSS